MSDSISKIGFYSYIPAYKTSPKEEKKSEAEVSYDSNPLRFCGSAEASAKLAHPELSTLSDPEDKKKYAAIEAILEKGTSGKIKVSKDLLDDIRISKTDLRILLNGGWLFKKGDDGLTMLDNLYKIATEPIVGNIDNYILLICTMHNMLYPPKGIKQTADDIPRSERKKIFQATFNPSDPAAPKKLEDIDIKRTATCPAASMEFELARRNPAEYVRFVAGFTSPAREVKTVIQYDDISENTMDAMSVLSSFKTQTKPLGWKEVEVTIKPDDNAYLRFFNQIKNYDKGERNPISILMQSAFMNLAARGTYNSITDKLVPAEGDSGDNEGLTEYEKTFMETIVRNERITSLRLQKISPDGKVEGYYYDLNKIKDLIIQTLADRDILIGYTEEDANGQLAGHEITITGTHIKNGELYFVCNDTDDGYEGFIEAKASELLPKIHHLAVPDEIIAQNNIEVV